MAMLRLVEADILEVVMDRPLRICPMGVVTMEDIAMAERFGDKTMPNMPQEPTVNTIVAETVTTHTRFVWGLEASLLRDRSMSTRLVLRVTTHPRDMGGLEDSLFWGKIMSNRQQKSMATGTMAK